MASGKHILLVCGLLASLFPWSDSFGGRGRLWRTEASQNTQGQPWPMPQDMITSTDAYGVNAEMFEFRVKGRDCDMLRAAIKRYHNTVFGAASTELRFRPMRGGEAGSVVALDVVLDNPCEDYPSLEMDEACRL